MGGRSLGEMAMRILAGTYESLASEAFAEKSPELGKLVQPLIDQMLVLEVKARADMGKIMQSSAVMLYDSSPRSCRACVADLLREEENEQTDNGQDANKATVVMALGDTAPVAMAGPQITVQPPTPKGKGVDDELNALSVKELKR